MLPEIQIKADSQISVSGLLEQYPHLLHTYCVGLIHTALFFLHPHVTAYINIGGFDIYLTNAEILIGCLVCLKDDFFKIIQSRKERTSSYSFGGYHDFVAIKEGEITIIEPFGMAGKDTDKIASC